jgi:CrcB protein
VSAATWIGVAALGGVGAVLRYVVDAAVTARTSRVLPVGIFVVNLSGSFALGLLDGRSTIVALGLLGAYTTFSTWMLQTHVLLRSGRRRLAITYVLASLALGVLAMAAGRGLA